MGTRKNEAGALQPEIPARNRTAGESCKDERSKKRYRQS